MRFSFAPETAQDESPTSTFADHLLMFHISNFPSLALTNLKMVNLKAMPTMQRRYIRRHAPGGNHVVILSKRDAVIVPSIKAQSTRYCSSSI